MKATTPWLHTRIRVHVYKLRYVGEATRTRAGRDSMNGAYENNVVADITKTKPQNGEIVAVEAVDLNAKVHWTLRANISNVWLISNIDAHATHREGYQREEPPRGVSQEAKYNSTGY